MLILIINTVGNFCDGVCDVSNGGLLDDAGWLVVGCMGCGDDLCC